MPNPRFIGKENEPTVELLLKLARAKEVYLGNLERFCLEEGINPEELKKVDRVYLIGSHATEDNWNDKESDVDFKLIVPNALPMYLLEYKRKILDPILCPKNEKKSRWIDLFFVREDYQVLPPRIDLTEYWNHV